MEAKTVSAQQTQKIAQDLGRTLRAGDIVAISGSLGAGKTIFVQGLAKSLGIKKRITSPTFIYMRSYPVTVNGQSLTFYHLDLFRGKNLSDFQALGLDEILFSKDAIIVIEWADRIKDALPKRRIDVVIKVVNEETRRIFIKRNK